MEQRATLTEKRNQQVAQPQTKCEQPVVNSQVVLQDFSAVERKVVIQAPPPALLLLAFSPAWDKVPELEKAQQGQEVYLGYCLALVVQVPLVVMLQALNRLMRPISPLLTLPAALLVPRVQVAWPVWRAWVLVRPREVLNRLAMIHPLPRTHPPRLVREVRSRLVLCLADITMVDLVVSRDLSLHRFDGRRVGKCGDWKIDHGLRRGL